MATNRFKSSNKVIAYYNGKAIDMASYVVDPKQRFSLACYRVRDNPAPGRSDGEGYVLDDEKVYKISPASRMAKIVLGDERDRVFAEANALLPK